MHTEWMGAVQTSTPQQRIAAGCARHGPGPLTAACVALLRGRPDEVSGALITVLGGESARTVLDGDAGGRSGYWPRVWAARGLLHAWDPAAADVIVEASRDEAWRVREMAAKVVARHQVGDAFDAVTALRDDPVERVRAAAARAVTVLVAAGA
jgi:HEAT repeats